MLRFIKQWSLKDLKALAKQSNRLVYAMNTCWWKIGGPIYSHLDCNLPCGPRSEMLLEMDNPLEFIELAEKNPEHYGKYGLDAFVAAYHGNVIVAKTGLPTSLESWDKYNELLDQEESNV